LALRPASDADGVRRITCDHIALSWLDLRPDSHPTEAVEERCLFQEHVDVDVDAIGLHNDFGREDLCGSVRSADNLSDLGESGGRAVRRSFVGRIGRIRARDQHHRTCDEHGSELHSSSSPNGADR
jgi:hypothetical protein